LCDLIWQRFAIEVGKSSTHFPTSIETHYAIQNLAFWPEYPLFLFKAFKVPENSYPVYADHLGHFQVVADTFIQL